MLPKDSIIIPGATAATRNAQAEASVRRLENLFPAYGDSSTLRVACHRSDYSASKIARAVEDCDAHLLNLNVTSETDPESGHIIVELRVDHLDPESVARSLERYGYEVVCASFKGDRDESLIRTRYDELMHYLNL